MNDYSVTLGVTINLGNYENLKVEITGPLESPISLQGALDDRLAMLGRDDPQAMAAIDSYRRRVLGTATVPDLAAKPAPYVNKSQRGDPNKCGKCGRSSSDVPQPKIAFVGGIYQCVECYKAGKAGSSSAVGDLLVAEIKALDEAGKVTCTSPPAGERQVTMSAEEPAEEKTSRLFFQKKMCRQCLTSANADGASA